jgi:hypothetical protein
MQLDRLSIDNLRLGLPKQSRDPRVNDDLTRLLGRGGDRGIVPTREKAVVLCATGATDVKRPDSSDRGTK